MGNAFTSVYEGRNREVPNELVLMGGTTLSHVIVCPKWL